MTVSDDMNDLIRRAAGYPSTDEEPELEAEDTDHGKPTGDAGGGPRGAAVVAGPSMNDVLFRAIRGYGRND